MCIRDSAKRVIAHINHTGELDARLKGKTRYQKRLNIYRALAIQDRGVAVSGVVASNTQNMNTKDFTSGVNSGDPALGAQQIGQLGQALSDIIKKAGEVSNRQPLAETKEPTAL